MWLLTEGGRWRWFLDGHWVLLEFFAVLACKIRKTVYSMCVAPKGSRGIRLWLTMEVRLL